MARKMSTLQCELNFVCTLCSGVLKDPQQATCCGSLFCKSCISEKSCPAIKDNSNTCPTCNKRQLTYFPDKHVERLMSEVGSHSLELSNSSVSNDVRDFHPEYGTDKNELLESTDCRRDAIPINEVGCHAKSQKEPVECCLEDSTLHPPEDQSSCQEVADSRSGGVLPETICCLTTELYQLKKKFNERQQKIEQMLETQEKLLRTLGSKVETLEKRVCSHDLLPYRVIMPNILSYIEGEIGNEWKSPDFYTGTYSNKGYKLQLSIVPNSLHMRKKEKALSTRLLITNGEDDCKLAWPFHARFNLLFVDPTGTERPYEVTGRHTWKNPGDQSSMQFIACITHKDLLKYVQHDNNLHVWINDN